MDTPKPAAPHCLFEDRSAPCLADVQHEAIVDAPFGKVDLPAWQFGLADCEYRGFSPDHIAAAVSTSTDGRRVAIRVDKLGDSLLVGHYVEEAREPVRCRLRSLSDLVTAKARLGVWIARDLWVEPVDEQTCRLVCRVQAHATPDMINALALEGEALSAFRESLRRDLARHAALEIGPFAESIANQIAGRPPRTRPAAHPGDAGDALLAASSCVAIVHAPIGVIDLGAWLYALPDAVYRTCSQDHVAAGVTTGCEGSRLSINVEQPGAFMVQHYREDVTGPAYCRVVSARSDMFSPAGHTTNCVTWELSLQALDAERCELTNTITCQATPDFMAKLRESGATLEAVRARTSALLVAHNAEETPKFAADLGGRWLGR